MASFQPVDEIIESFDWYIGEFDGRTLSMFCGIDSAQETGRFDVKQTASDVENLGFAAFDDRDLDDAS